MGDPHRPYLSASEVVKALTMVSFPRDEPSTRYSRFGISAAARWFIFVLVTGARGYVSCSESLILV